MIYFFIHCVAYLPRRTFIQPYFHTPHYRDLIDMALEGKGTIYMHESAGARAYIPSSVGSDSGFPFDAGEKVRVKIIGDSVVLSSLEEE